jgi:Holliday junction resolvase-like predicted endonuclease
MKYLKEKLNKLISQSKFNKSLRKKLEHGELEFIMVTLVHERILKYDEYLKLKKEYEKRNKYLDIIKITSPRAFGETWAEEHILEILPELESTKGTEAKGEYDLVYRKEKKFVKLEVKAGRAIDRTKHNVPYHERALVSTDKKGLFDMNFQQMKPTCFDAIIMIGVWADKIRYWFMTSEEIRNNKYFSVGQHRGNKGYEGQIHIKTENISDFKKYEVTPKEILEKIKKLSSQ